MRCWLGVSLVLAGCARSFTLPDDSPVDASSPCGAPSHVTYSCAPLATGAAGCHGPPSAYPTASVPDPDTEYAVGCSIMLPFCHPFYASEVAECTCSAGSFPGDPPQWGCPL